mgnify:CR=1 FL=1
MNYNKIVSYLNGLRSFHLYRNQTNGEYRVSINYHEHPYSKGNGMYVICHGPIFIEQYMYCKLLERD